MSNSPIYLVGGRSVSVDTPIFRVYGVDTYQSLTLREIIEDIDLNRAFYSETPYTADNQNTQNIKDASPQYTDLQKRLIKDLSKFLK